MSPPGRHCNMSSLLSLSQFLILGQVSGIDCDCFIPREGSLAPATFQCSGAAMLDYGGSPPHCLQGASCGRPWCVARVFTSRAICIPGCGYCWSREKLGCGIKPLACTVH